MDYGQIQLVGGSFQDPLQNPVANGVMRLVLTQSESADGYLFELLSPYTVTKICNGMEVFIPLDDNGNLVVSPAYAVYANDVLEPANSYYLVTVYKESGERLWGPNPQQVFYNLSPFSDTFDVSQWVPGQITES